MALGYAQNKARHHRREVPAQFLLPGLCHQFQQIALVGLKESRSGSRYFLRRIGRPHPYKRVIGTETGDQLGKQSGTLGDERHYAVGAADGPSISSR
jgi:hypothetical protein